MQLRRLPGRPVCSPFPTKPYPFVPGSKFFTQLPAGKRNFAGVRSGRFAPLSPLSLIPSFRGANSSHNSRPERAGLPVAGPTSLLPVPREALSLRFGEQILHTTSGRKAQFRRRPGRPVCSPLPAKPLISISLREPRTGNFEIGGPGAGTVRARLLANPLISVSLREPRTGNFEIGGPGAGTVRARLPANPLISVPGREPRTGNFEIGGPGAGTVRARFPAKHYAFVPGSKFFT